MFNFKSFQKKKTIDSTKRDITLILGTKLPHVLVKKCDLPHIYLSLQILQLSLRVHDIDTTTAQSIIANLLLPTHVLTKMTYTLSVLCDCLCTSVCYFLLTHMFVSPLFCLTNALRTSHGPTQASLMSENPQYLCFLFSCPVSRCYYLSISSQANDYSV